MTFYLSQSLFKNYNSAYELPSIPLNKLGSVFLRLYADDIAIASYPNYKATLADKLIQRYKFSDTSWNRTSVKLYSCESFW